MDNQFKFTITGPGQGAAYSAALAIRHLYDNNLHKRIIVNPDGSISVKEEEVKKEEKPSESRKGWRNYSDKNPDENKRSWV